MIPDFITLYSCSIMLNLFQHLVVPGYHPLFLCHMALFIHRVILTLILKQVQNDTIYNAYAIDMFYM